MPDRVDRVVDSRRAHGIVARAGARAVGALPGTQSELRVRPLPAPDSAGGRVLVVPRPERTAAAQALAWLLGVALTLVPWMTYSWRATGVPLVKSTNQGHVLLLGLGQDPKGRFGFTYSDGDPRMYAILRDQLGDAFARRCYASCSYEAGRVLRPAFTTAVLIRPWDYADLVQTKLRRILTGSVGTLRGRVRSRRESRPVRHRGEDSQSPEPALAA